ncbi:hypothetical protein L2E82_40865 [Cichorium intybus]|uniref:Uncharacterized protein n=1 Tax=Cichorium intybus TaxID=13427 RepID=A0ACB9AMJ3_CICIN|nr:hypothetical protein L2E82_40865 [Cichorium intybus]
MVEEDPEELPITGLYIITPGIKNSMRVNLITPGIKNPTHPSQHLENKDDAGQLIATPKQIRVLMQLDGLTNDEVAKVTPYFIHTKRSVDGKKL